MTFEELRALANRDFISPDEFQELYMRLVNNGGWGKAAFLASLMYLQALEREDPETPDILELLRTSVDGCIEKGGEGKRGS